MATAISSYSGIPQGMPYDGPVEINEEKEDGGTTVYLYTEDLRIRSVRREDLPHYQKMLGDTETMKTFATGVPYTPEKTVNRMDIWLKRWESSDCFSAFSYFRKEDDAFVGYRVLGHGEHQRYCSDLDVGYSETASVNVKDFRGKGYSKQGTFAIVREFAPYMAEQNSTVTTWFEDDDGKSYCRDLPLKWVTATALTEKDDSGKWRNNPSLRVLTGVGMELKSEAEKYGGMRGCFALDVSQLETKATRL